MRPIDVEQADEEQKLYIAKTKCERLASELKAIEMERQIENYKRGKAPDAPAASGTTFASQSATPAGDTVDPGAGPAAVIGGRAGVGEGGAAGDQSGGAVGTTISGKRRHKTKVREFRTTYRY